MFKTSQKKRSSLYFVFRQRLRALSLEFVSNPIFAISINLTFRCIFAEFYLFRAGLTILKRLCRKFGIQRYVLRCAPSPFFVIASEWTSCLFADGLTEDSNAVRDFTVLIASKNNRRTVPRYHPFHPPHRFFSLHDDLRVQFAKRL